MNFMNKLSKTALFTLVLMLLLIANLDSLVVFARAGGGHSYSSGSSRSSSSSSSSSSSRSYSSSSSGSSSYSDFSDISCLEIVILIIIVVIYILFSMANEKWKEFKKRNHLGRQYDPEERLISVLKKFNISYSSFYKELDTKLTAYKNIDPNFSRQAFLDFVQLLYTRYQTERGNRDFRFTRFYISQATLDKILNISENNISINNVVIGSCRIADIYYENNAHVIVVQLEANYDKKYIIPGKDKTIIRSYFSEETWLFSKNDKTLSPEPEKLQNIACPNCGSSSEPPASGECVFCHNIVKDGSFSWFADLTVNKLGPKRAISTGAAIEEGTDLPTIISPDKNKKISELTQQDPDFSMSEFLEYVSTVFLNIQEGWSTRDLNKLRPYESDNIYNMHKYWIETYLRENKANIIEDIDIIQIEPARVEIDNFYETITVRIFAKMYDYTIKASDKSGKMRPSHPVTFSEYWTFMRHKGVTTGSLSTNNCPNCGAVLQINSAGICTYCDSKITTGRFSWILSMIDQDEVYR